MKQTKLQARYCLLQNFAAKVNDFGMREKFFSFDVGLGQTLQLLAVMLEGARANRANRAISGHPCVI